jgi:FkbM family methyltransferase
MDNTQSVMPRVTRAILEQMAPYLPNRWMCYRLVKWSGATASTVETLGNGMKVEVFFGDIIGCHIHYSGWYEQQVVAAVQPFMDAGTVFVDVGANIGQYSLMASPLVRHVFAFEPNPATFALLKRNIERNRLSNVTLSQAAVSCSDGEATIFDLDPTNHGAASMTLTGEGGQKIRTAALDSLCDNPQLAGCRLFLKIDVEGAELDVLRGAKRLISQFRPTILIEVLESNQNRLGRTAQDLLDALRDCGYSFQSIGKSGLVPFDPEHSNVLATAHGQTMRC